MFVLNLFLLNEINERESMEELILQDLYEFLPLRLSSELQKLKDCDLIYTFDSYYFAVVNLFLI